MTKLFRLFTKKLECEYWVRLSDIVITENFLKHSPNKYKLAQKYDWYEKNGEFQSPIILNKNYELVDGYTSYIIAKDFDLGKVPVYFID